MKTKAMREEIEEILENTHNGCECKGCTSKIYRVLVTKEFLALFHKLGEEEYKRGRQSVLDEWKEEKNKLLQGFGYKKIG